MVGENGSVSTEPAGKSEAGYVVLFYAENSQFFATGSNNISSLDIISVLHQTRYSVIATFLLSSP